MSLRPELKDVLELIVQYDVRQRERMPRKNIAGFIDSGKMEILIRRKQSVMQKVDTLIHEAIHAYYFDRGVNVSEEKVEEDTRRLMRELYGERDYLDDMAQNFG